MVRFRQGRTEAIAEKGRCDLTGRALSLFELNSYTGLLQGAERSHTKSTAPHSRHSKLANPYPGPHKFARTPGVTPAAGTVA
jgi:hypothetical protein